jgi:uncharacterized membrane protein YedE/YeeE
MEWILQPWPWYISGPLIGLMVPALLLLSGKNFGVSTSFQHIGSMCSPRTNLPYLKGYNWRSNSWRLVFVAGIVIGAFIGAHLLSATPSQFLPSSYYSWSGVIALAVGGLLIGFGTRYADGCTSGHSIMGLSSLQWVSLVATVSFFAGGLLMTHVIRPILPF